MLDKSDDIGSLNGLVWQLVLSLFVAWIVCFLCLFRGVKVKLKFLNLNHNQLYLLKINFGNKKLSGKIVYFTALFPYLVLFILGGRALFLEGASIGIEYYITPRVEKLLDPTVWKDAAGKAFSFL